MMPPFTEHVVLMAWIAGYFEGEGTISITRSGRRGYTRPLVSLASVDRSVIEYFQSRYPGTIRSRNPPGNAKTAYTWRIDNRGKIARFLYDLMPYFRTERVRNKAVLVLDDIGARVQGAKGAEYRQECQDRMMQIRELNHRGTTPFRRAS